ncbi:MAG: CDP-alcohol phosphatidyltransferase family protein [Rhodothermales bacterium]
MPLVFAGLASFGFFILKGKALWTPHGGFGSANPITLARLLLTCSLLFVGTGPYSGWIVFVVALIVLITDGFDGWMARRKSEASEFGEYFDKEADAFFLLILCFLAFFQGRVGPWIVIPGLLRYAFVVVMVLMKPELDKEYRSRWARVIYVTMIIALLAVFITPAWFFSPLLAVGTTGLFLSFAHYFRWMFSSSNTTEPTSKTRVILKAVLAGLFLNSLLLTPSLIANLATSTFLPIPDPSQPLATLTWTRGWYDYLLYFFIRRPNQDLFRICADMVLIITLLLIWQKKNAPKTTVPWIFTAGYLGLVIYEAYDAMVFQFFHRNGIVYEDIQYILNLYYLAIDAFSLEHLFSLIIVVTIIVLLSWWIPVLFSTVLKAFALPRAQKNGLVFSYVFWPLFICAWMWYGPGNERPTVRSISGKIVVNAVESVKLAQTISSIEQLPVDRVYNDFDQFPMAEKPNIYLLMIESYGRVLMDNEHLRPAYDKLMASFQDQFTQSGWHTASTYSKAPVSGGLSWLSMNSVLSGLFMDNKTFYTRYLSKVHAYPHLVRFLKQQGYYTLTLQPPTKARAGLSVDNHYDFDKTVYFDDLHYKGKSYSIWVIPDQYSLGYTHEHYLPKDSTPFFLFFETATTHAPWSNLPPYLEDWRAFNTETESIEETGEKDSFLTLVQDSYNNRFSKDTPGTVDLYLESIAYDLTLLTDYALNEAPENSLFIILGDHQPPLIPSSDYDTPIHVISRNAALLDKFKPYGFEAGLMPPDQSIPSFTHAGIYSMLIDVITHDDQRASELPSKRYRPEGIAPSILTHSN